MGEQTEGSQPSVKDSIKEKYGHAALRVTSGGACCSGTTPSDPISSDLYNTVQKNELPDAAIVASLGCGNPTALTQLKEGEIVLDLGSGGGIDVLLAARRVSPGGKVYGLDMTDEMLELAKQNQQASGIQNVEFIKGEIESIPLPDQAVDVVISNCVINLSSDKDRVLAEVFRVLRPGGRIGISDVITKGSVHPEIRKNVLLWVGCLAGALDQDEYRSKLQAIGFIDVTIQPTRVYRAEDARPFLLDKGLSQELIDTEVSGKFMSAFVSAGKPSGN